MSEHQPACASHDPELFFPDRSEEQYVLPLARSVCNACPVQARCLASSLTEEYGIWAGTSEQQRRSMRRKTGVRRSGSAVIIRASEGAA